ncbi:MAG: HK97 family phage prohead protease [Paludibacter sp.]|nr:HK97 family phage prohead protease [Bacteroidales bacterium]MCM1069834.1 HK97 family phage prohead protease [Prevotella sp.]MCM1353972.1 HK97 family phage prohead protease [Bacteroides sp.]MCM1443386.1 HK97 family phage prohead protease [Muribaculum sp.]MCM1482089.1 HK97 family phage prohead protease [Paludibacter sp.]
MSKEVIISNSTLNSYGFRVLTSGIDLTQYQRNPILLWMHMRPWRGTTDEVMPLGRIENLRIEGDNLIGTPVFDDQDEFAQKVKAKWDAGILKMVSAGLDVIEQSDAPEVLVQGQRRATVTKCKLREVSIVDMGANDDALVLYENGKMIKLSDTEGIDTIQPIKQQLNTYQMKAIALKLGLAEHASEAEVLTAIGNLQAEAASSVELRSEIEQQKEDAIVGAVDHAIQLQRITTDKKDHFVSLGKQVGLETLQKTLELMHPAVRPSSIIEPTSIDSGYKTLRDVPSDKIAQLRAENSALYNQLYKAEYGIAPVND